MKQRMNLRVGTATPNELNRVLVVIERRLDQLEGIGQNPNFHGAQLTKVGASLKGNQALTQDPFSKHNHSLANLDERDYGSIDNRPADDDFSTLKAATALAEDDTVPIWDKSGKNYRQVSVETLRGVEGEIDSYFFGTIWAA